MEQPNWPPIADLYGALIKLQTAVVELNRTELLKRAGEREGASRAYQTAIKLSANAVQRAELERRLQDL